MLDVIVDGMMRTETSGTGALKSKSRRREKDQIGSKSKFNESDHA